MSIMETWKDIKGFEGRYQISNLGRVKSLPRIVIQEHTAHNHPVARKIQGTIIKPSDNGKGYKIVLLRLLNSNGRRKQFYVHRLVAEAFIGAIPQGYVINHKDYDRANNAAENLEIVTQAQNTRYSIPNMRKPLKTSNSHTGEKHIYIRKRRYSIEVTYNNKAYYGGSALTMSDAIEKREKLYNEIGYYRSVTNA